MAVQSLGFGALLHLNITEIPGKLAYWCASQFDQLTCSILMPDGTQLHISEEDIWVTVGVPKGTIAIERKCYGQEKSFLEEWASNIGKDVDHILPQDLPIAMESDTTGGIWFKTNFLILVENSIFESPADGYVRPKIVSVLKDLVNAHKYNWCSYMITTLLLSHNKWLKSKKKEIYRANLVPRCEYKLYLVNLNMFTNF